MIWGCNWDQICKFINKNGDKASLIDSTSYGNYHGNLQVTGYNDFWKTNNIYDIAGNCREWTQESYSNDARVCRGGSCTDNTTQITNRDVSNKPTKSDAWYTSSRPVLYINLQT